MPTLHNFSCWAYASLAFTTRMLQRQFGLMWWEGRERGGRGGEVLLPPPCGVRYMLRIDAMPLHILSDQMW